VHLHRNASLRNSFKVHMPQPPSPLSREPSQQSSIGSGVTFSANVTGTPSRKMSRKTSRKVSSVGSASLHTVHEEPFTPGIEIKVTDYDQVEEDEDQDQDQREEDLEETGEKSFEEA